MNQKSEYDPKLSSREWSGAISRLGIKKANTRFWQLLLLGLLGGLYISFGGHLYLVALASGAGRIVAAFLFSIGLVLVVVAGAELFTGNIIMVVGLIGGRYNWGKLFKNWGAVYLGNLLGSLAYAMLMWKSGLFGSLNNLNDVGELALVVAEAKALLPFGQAFIRGVFCNILVILAILMSLMAKDVVSKVITCMLPIAAFVTIGFEHCVANMFLMPIGFLAGGSFIGNLIPISANILTVTLGNVVGGIFIIIVHPNRLRQLRFLRKQPGVN